MGTAADSRLDETVQTPATFEEDRRGGDHMPALSRSDPLTY